jgi:hypothetical protein
MTSTTNDLNQSVHLQQTPEEMRSGPYGSEFIGGPTSFRTSFESACGAELSAQIKALRDKIKSSGLGLSSNFDFELIISNVEGLLLFIEDVRADPTFQHCLLASARFVKGVSGKSLTSLATQLTNLLFTGFEVQSDSVSYLDAFMSFVKDSESFTSSDFVKRTRKFLSITISYVLVNSFGYDLEDDLVQRRFSLLVNKVEKVELNCLDFWTQILTYSAYIYERGKIYMECGNITSFFGIDSTMSKWSQRCDKALVMAMHLGNPSLAWENGVVDQPFNAFSLKDEVDDLINQSEAYRLTLSSCGYLEKKTIMSYVSRLRLAQLDIVKEIQSYGVRKQPFGIIFTGKSAQLKSWLSRYVFHTFAAVMSDLGTPLEDDPDRFFYVKNPYEKFWTNFSPAMWAILLDDMATIKADKLKEVPPDIQNFIHVQNNVPFTPEQAAIERKGITPLKNLLTVGTSNAELLNLSSLLNCPLAALRRWHLMIRVELKEEYVDNTMVDCSKVPENISDFDMWNFIPYYAAPQGDHGAVRAVHLEPITSFAEFTDFLVAAIKKYAGHQDKAVKAMEDLKGHERCTKCYVLLQNGPCMRHEELVVQSAFDYAIRVYNRGQRAYNTYVSERSLGVQEYPQNIEFPSTEWQFLTYESLIMFLIGVLWVFFWLTTFLLRGFVKITQPLSYFHWMQSLRLWLLILAYRLDFYIMGVVLSFFTSRISRRIKRKLLKTKRIAKVFALLAAFASAAFFVARRFKDVKVVSTRIRKTKKSKNVTFTQQGNIPTPMKEQERERVWFNSDPSLHMSELSQVQKTGGTCSLAAFTEKIYPNVFKGLLIKGDEVGDFQALCLGGHLYVTNKHHFIDEKDGITLGNFLSGSGVRPLKTIPLQSIKMWSAPGTDLMFMWIEDLPDCNDITSYVMSGPLKFPCIGRSVARLDNGRKKVYDLIALTSEKMRHPNVSWTSDNQFDSVYGRLSGDLTVFGDCGMPLITKLGEYGCAILGIHVGLNAKEKVGISQVLLQSHIEQAKRELGIDFLVQSGIPLLSLDGSEVEIEAMHFQSPLLYFPKGSAKMYGRMPGFRQESKSRVKHTFIHDGVILKSAKTSMPHMSQHGPPCMKGYAPKRNALTNIFSSASGYNARVLDECVQSFLKDIREKLSLEQIQMLEVYTDEVAVNGHCEVTYVDPIKRKTSAGYPWRKSKKFLLKEVDPLPFAPNPIDFIPEVWDRVRIIEEKLKRGERSMPVFTAHLKDEPVSESKIKSKATRMFSGAPLDFSLVMRKYFLSSVRLIQNNRFVFEAGAGTVVQSPEWREIFDYLTQHGEEQVVAGDYANFDKSMFASFILAAFRILEELCRSSGNFDDKELLLMRTLAADVAFPLTDFFGDLVMFYGTNPSGHPLTVIINGLVNSLYMRYCYHCLNPQHEVSSFQKCVSLMTYGDDLIMGVSASIPWFNHTTIAQELSEIRILFTMADKEQESVPYISIWEATFLKRSFCLDLETGIMMCPLEFKSKNKTLLWGVETALCPEYHSLIKLRDVLSDFFFYGREVFDERRALYLDIARDHDLGRFCPMVKGTQITLDQWFSTFDDELRTFKSRARISS